MDIAETLARLVRTARNAFRADDCLTSLGFGQTAFEKIYGDLADAIYYLIGERSESFETSITHLALNAAHLSDDDRVSMLLAEYEKNRLCV